MKHYTDFNEFREFFNRWFSLSINGKFFGLLRLAEYGIDWQRFAYRLYKILNGYFRKLYRDVISMKFHGVTIKLYSR